MKLKVKVSTSHPELSALLLRQTPGCRGVWSHCEFHVNSDLESCDWWFVCHNSALNYDQSTVCDPNQIVFISMEPYDDLPYRFYKQFAHVVCCDPQLRHPSLHRANGLTWWAGINVDFSQGHRFSAVVNHDYDSFSSMAAPANKWDRISVITSNKTFIPGHQRRLAFIEKLKCSQLSDRIDFYGGGHNPIPDKLAALLPYKYHLTLENSQIPGYWTEKLADPLLAYCLPFYHGCPDIHDFFSPDACVPIDIDCEADIAMMEQAIVSDLYSQRLAAITAARQQVLHEFNIFELMASIASRPASQLKRSTVFHPGHFKPSLFRRAVSKMRRLFSEVSPLVTLS